MERKIVWVLVLGLVLQGCLAFPRADPPSSESQSSEDDTQQQQEQNIDSEALGEFTKKIKTKGRANVNEKLKNGDLDDPCLDPKKIGVCKAAVPRFYLNKAEGKCEFFVFGGCSGNRNNFKGLSDCETTCAKHLRKEVIPKSALLDDDTIKNERICSLPTLNNPNGIECMAYMPRWTYDSVEKKCKEFIYGGCGGTKNIFGSQSLCESTCGGDKKSENLDDPTPTAIGTSISIISPDVCSLPMDKGFCYAIKYKYFFNKEDNRCEKFEYGGCGGNQNRFNSAEECVRTCGGDAPAHDPECANVTCPWGLYTHYTTLECTPIYDGQSCCPTRFECPDKIQSNNTIDGARSLTLPTEEPQPKCSYKGKSYAIGTNVPEASDSGSCRAACLCTRGYAANEGAKITCASIECPEQLGAPGKAGCVPVYKRGSCCAYDWFCPNDTLTIIDPQTPMQEPEAQTSENFKCEVDGRGYFEGQRFYPKKSPCLKCICQKGFNGTISEEFCENIDCGIEIYYSHYLAKGCAPVYFQSQDGTSSCCPISWECPDDRKDTPVAPMPVATQTPNPVGPVPPTRPVGPVPPTKPVGTFPVSVTPGTPPVLEVPNPTMAVLPVKPERESRRTIVTLDACQLPKEVGECKARRTRYFYNKETSMCEEFIYTGCRGNQNNFASIQDCQRLCTPIPSDSDNRGLLRSLDTNQQEPQPRAIYVTEVDPCTMPKIQGNCKGFFPRFYYSPEDNSCKSFIFGGCRGNRNNFYTRESCEATCTNSISRENLRTNVLTGSSGDASMVNFGEDVPAPSTNSKSIGTDVDPCSLPKTIGFCKASIRRFHYDSVAKECKEFFYGGCGGNANNFLNRRDCDRRCIVKEVGVPRTRTQIQVQPTDQNTSNLSAPEDTVGPPSFGFLERCRLPRKSGSCLGIHPSYYYDTESGSCNFFFYSGCYGNANRFSSMEVCESTCKTVPAVSNEQEGIGGRMSVNRNSWRSSVTGNDDSSTGNDMVQPASNRPRPSTSNALQNPKDGNDKEMCKLAPEAGRCKAYVLRYHWNAETKQCLPFVWSGCRGNKNNFLTESDCLSACGEKPTIEQLTSEGVLSCSFGNETLPLGATLGGHRYSPDTMPCGVPICQCLTPPSVTCVQLMCPTPPPEPVTEKVCPTPNCDNCKQTVGVDGCSTCDCDDDSQQVQVQEPIEVFVKSVKG